jgi:CheY-like chemotaxis protein
MGAFHLPGEGESLKILLIDEMVLLREMEQSFFKRKGLQILLAQNGAEVIQKAIEEKPDLIILDMKMSQADGVTCCQKIRTHRETENIPILLMASEKEAREFQQIGIHGFIEKPITQNSIMENLSRFLSVKRRRSHRLPFVRKVHCSQEEESAVDLFSKNICRNGIFLKSKSFFPKGSVVNMCFNLLRREGSEIKASGEIVRSVEYEKDSHLIAGMGVHFQNIQKKDQQLIADYIEKNL